MGHAEASKILHHLVWNDPGSKQIVLCLFHYCYVLIMSAVVVFFDDTVFTFTVSEEF